MNETRELFNRFRNQFVSAKVDTNLKRTILPTDVSNKLVAEAIQIVKIANHQFFTTEMIAQVALSTGHMTSRYVLADRNLVKVAVWMSGALRASLPLSSVNQVPTMDQVLESPVTEQLIAHLDSSGLQYTFNKLLSCLTRSTLFEKPTLEAEITQDCFLLSCLLVENYRTCPELVYAVSLEASDFIRSLSLKSSRRAYRSMLPDFLKYAKADSRNFPD